MFLLQAILMGIFPFYRVDFPIKLFPKYFIYIEYDTLNRSKDLIKSNGLIIKEKDAKYIALKEFFVKEKQGWVYDLVTYAPNKIFDSSKMKINCLNNFIVVNYETENKKWLQISKKSIKDCKDFLKL